MDRRDEQDGNAAGEAMSATPARVDGAIVNDVDDYIIRLGTIEYRWPRAKFMKFMELMSRPCPRRATCTPNGCDYPDCRYKTAPSEKTPTCEHPDCRGLNIPAVGRSSGIGNVCAQHGMLAMASRGHYEPFYGWLRICPPGKCRAPQGRDCDCVVPAAGPGAAPSASAQPSADCQAKLAKTANALRGMVGLVQLVQDRYPDFPVDNHRIIAAQSALNDLDRDRSASK